MEPVIRGAGAWVCGLGFGGGLVLAGMTRPAAVRAFLDPLGGWNPSLLVVMGAAALVHAGAWALAAHLRRPVPALRTHLDLRLVGGAALFGVGWGLGGTCPGPALVALGTPSPRAWVFVAAMVAGTWLAGRVPRPAVPPA